jgi:hypothetical protein
MYVALVLVACETHIRIGGKRATDNPKVVLKRLFKVKDLGGIEVVHSFLGRDTLMSSARTTLQITIPQEDFARLMKNAGGVKMNIPRGEIALVRHGGYQFDRDIRGTLPAYESQPGGIPIYELKTVYKIEDSVLISEDDGTSAVRKTVTSYAVVDDRTTPTYAVFLSVGSYLRYLEPE